MQIEITGHHIDVTEAMRSHVLEKFSRLEKHFDKLLEVHVILSVEKLSQKAEATVHINGANLFAEDTQADLYTAIDNLVDKLDRQVLKHKEKHLNH
ncbi:MAG TPA: ribosome-associated translation inhibitor RaiA [Methylococcaceae bacterium]|jgi:putative sigma-54 modulation protein|nr:ribosome-associated translation inhibitor RaiA [Methylococcaceae bacterium]